MNIWNIHIKVSKLPRAHDIASSLWNAGPGGLSLSGGHGHGRNKQLANWNNWNITIWGCP